ncbi:MAG: hypothetical protein IKM76_02675, partial [Prevotella sp.]|nr:hypothetical protein [Prevotella sp.]
MTDAERPDSSIPSPVNNIKVTTMAMPTSNNLFLTVPPMSATISLFLYACVLAAITAVSDIGAILSPRAAPDK